jgi:hypothetical protein
MDAVERSSLKDLARSQRSVSRLEDYPIVTGDAAAY